MTIPECSIEKSASVLVDIFGDAAPAHARERMDEYQPGVYKDGHQFWLAVAHAATKLLDEGRARDVRKSPLENTGANTGASVPLRPSMVRGQG
jgi:hypothetical protein